MPEPMMPDPRQQPAEPDADVAMVPVREVLSWLASTIGGPVGDAVMAALPAKPVRWTPPGQLVSSLNLLGDAAAGLLEDWDEVMAEPATETETTTVVSGDMAVELPAPPEVVVDLMAALERSVADAKAARARHQRGRPAASWQRSGLCEHDMAADEWCDTCDDETAD